MLKHLDQRRRDDEGFTLIELMVVVLIMGILAAIAIPTFLSTRSGASNTAGQSDVTNAVTNELSYYSTNGGFMGSAGGSTLDPNLPWLNQVTAPTATQPNQIVVVTTTAWGAAWVNSAAPVGTQLTMYVYVLASSGYCWQAFSDQTSGNSRTLYSVTTNGCPAVPLTTATEPVANGATGSAVKDEALQAAQKWDSSW